MSAAGPWSVKGIDPQAREIAKDLARRSGMTLGEWINHLIMEGGEDEPEPVPLRVPERPRPGRPFSSGSRLSSFSSRSGGYRTAAVARHEEDEPGDDLGRVTAALERLTERIESAERRSTLAITGIDQSVSGALARIETGEREHGMTAMRLDESLDDLRQAQDATIERLRRVETDDSPRRSAEALRALEQALTRIAGQLYESETRTQASIAELRDELGGVARRAAAPVAPPQPAVPAPDVVDGVVARIAERIEQAEGRTADAMRAMESSFAALDSRLAAAETQLAVPAIEPETDETRFERLAADLAQRVDASRLEMADRMNAAADSRIDQIDAAMREMAAHVEASEQRAADAVERMGREVLRVAEMLGRRVTEAEGKNAEAAERLGAAMDQRLGRSDASQAEAIERLGGEIARISERLADRIGASERRSSQAIDEVGEQVVRVTDKINQRYDRAAAELTDRIGQSEERTARLLEEARERIDQRIGEIQTRTATQAAPLQQSLAELASRIDQMESASPFGPGASFEPPTFTPNAFAAPSPSATAMEALGGPSPFEDAPPPALATPPLNARRPEEGRPAFDPFADFEADAPAPPELVAASTAPGAVAEADEAIEPMFADFPNESDSAEPQMSALAASAADPFAAADPFPAEGPATDLAVAGLGPVRDETPRSRSTREMLDAARTAARSANTPEPKGPAAPGPRPMPIGPLPKLTTRTTARRAPGAGGGQASPLRTALFVSGALAAVSVGAWTYWAMNNGAAREPAAGEPSAARPAATPGRPAASAPISTRPPAPAEPATGRAAAAALTGPQPAPAAPPQRPASTTAAPAVGPAAAATTAARPGVPAVPAQTPAAQYAAAVAQLNAGQREPGLAALRAAANSGHAPAQFYLARVYERGQYGVAANPVEARRWTERAAQAGETRAMHNLALFQFEGTGGPRNLTQAVSSFRRAAEAGLVDSQYNLGRMYEQGLGVPQNGAEAYRWYVIAGAGGDGEARAAVTRLRAQLSPEARSVAERSAAAFRAQRGLSAPVISSATPAAAAPAASAAAPAAAASDPIVGAAQRGLAQLGYYRGPTDGVATPGLRAAIVAYQRAQNLPVTGTADDALIARMAAAQR